MLNETGEYDNQIFRKILTEHGITFETSPPYIQEVDLARKATEAKTHSTKDWIRRHVKVERRHRPPPGGKIRKDLQRENKGIASPYFQLLFGHAAIGPYLADTIKTIQSDKCWRCGSGERQSRHHLFVKCRAWEAQIEELWKDVGKACEWKHPRAPTVRLLFRDERASPAVLRSCGTQRSEGWPRYPPGGKRASEGLDEIDLWPEEGQGACGEEWPVPPYSCCQKVTASRDPRVRFTVQTFEDWERGRAVGALQK